MKKLFAGIILLVAACTAPAEMTHEQRVNFYTDQLESQQTLVAGFQETTLTLYDSGLIDQEDVRELAPISEDLTNRVERATEALAAYASMSGSEAAVSGAITSITIGLVTYGITQGERL